MKKVYAILLFGWLLLSGTQVFAQNSEEYIYKDSSIMAPEAEQTIMEETETMPEVVVDEEVVSDNFLDTTLISNQRELSPDSVNTIKSREAFSYAANLDSLLKDLKAKEQQVTYSDHSNSPSWLDVFFASGITQLILWAVAIGFAGFILYNLFFAQGVFQRGSTKSRVKVIPEDEIAEANNDYDGLLQKALREQNFRLATRYLYLQLIHKLADAGAIEFAPDKTNTTYLRELTGKSYKTDVASLTRSYEYIWYGEFPVDQARFEGLYQLFQQMKNRL